MMENSSSGCVPPRDRPPVLPVGPSPVDLLGVEQGIVLRKGMPEHLEVVFRVIRVPELSVSEMVSGSWLSR